MEIQYEIFCKFTEIIAITMPYLYYNLILNAIEACENMDDADDIRDLSTWKADYKNHGYGSRNVREIVQKH